MKDLKIINIILQIVNVLLLLGLIVPTFCFSPHVYHQRSSPITRFSSPLASSTETASLKVEEEANTTDDEENVVVRSPLRMLGPYPTIPLKFPDLATSSQRERNITGVSLDWVLDTAANVNTINAQVALELCLEKVGEAPGGVGSGGAINGGDTFLLGDCELDIKTNDAKLTEDDNVVVTESDETFTFMKELTASALPVASPAAAGLLGLAFFYCFEGGVEFYWGLNKQQTPPAVLFYGSDEHLDVDDLTLVPFESLPESMLPSVTLIINGKEIPALFDTGSPITVINQAAATEAGIDTIIPSDAVNPDNKEGNFFSKIASNFKSANGIAKATQSGDILTIQGTDGKPTRLVKTKEQQDIHIKASSSRDKLLSSSQIFIGDIPGLVALGGIGGNVPPAAILGMDILSRCERVVFRARQNEIYL